MIRTFIMSLTSLAFLGASAPVGRADEIPEEYRDTVKRGLEYLTKIQFKDGHWGANGDQYPVSMTGLAGLALLMEGSTIREGKYSAQIRNCTNWLMERSMKDKARDGLVGNPDHPFETGRYMYGHGFATLFLACVYGDEEDVERRDKLKDILTRAAKYIEKAQSTQGGWYYTARGDMNPDNDEGSVTVTQMQALRACKNAGIPVSKICMEKGYEYLKNSTTPKGGVVYSLGRGGNNAPVGGERPALTAAAIACLFSAGEYKALIPPDEFNRMVADKKLTPKEIEKAKIVKAWFKFCESAIEIDRIGDGFRKGHDEYLHFYYAQAMYFIGDTGFEKMFGPYPAQTPASKHVKWTNYRKNMFDHLKATQNKNDGSWQGGGGFSVGAVYSTAIYCIIMQLDLGTLPVFQK